MLSLPPLASSQLPCPLHVSALPSSSPQAVPPCNCRVQNPSRRRLQIRLCRQLLWRNGEANAQGWVLHGTRCNLFLTPRLRFRRLSGRVSLSLPGPSRLPHSPSSHLPTYFPVAGAIISGASCSNLLLLWLLLLCMLHSPPQQHAHVHKAPACDELCLSSGARLVCSCAYVSLPY